MRIYGIKRIITGLLLSGFFIGIIYANIFAKSYITTMGIFSDYFLNQFSGDTLNTGDYIGYIMKVRLLPFLLLVILCGTVYKRAAGYISLFWTGFSGGLILTASVLKMNLMGIGFCFAAMMPHFICYAAAYTMLWLYIFFYPEIRWNATKTVSVVVFLLLGIITECYLNPVLMDMFISIL